MVQTEWNKQTVQECINTGSDCAQILNTGSNCYQACVNDRPYKEQNACYDNRSNGCDDCHTSFTGEERQCIRQLCILKFVVTYRTDHTGKDTDKLVLDFAKCHIGFCTCHSGNYATG